MARGRRRRDIRRGRRPATGRPADGCPDARRGLRLLRRPGPVVAAAGGSGAAPGGIAADPDRLADGELLRTDRVAHPSAGAGQGPRRGLARRLLAGRGERNVLLSTPEIRGEDNRAWRLYRRLGFTDIIRGHHFAGDPRAFAILGRKLPL